MELKLKLIVLKLDEEDKTLKGRIIRARHVKERKLWR